MEYSSQTKTYRGIRYYRFGHSKQMLAKQVDFKLLNEEGLWQPILKRKYLKNKTLSQVEKKKGDSHFWSGLMQVKRLVSKRSRFKIQDGTQTRFWEDLWIGTEPLMTKYPSLYNIVRKKNVTVARVLSTTPLNISFRRALVGDNWAKWLQLVGSILNVHLGEQTDTFMWTKSKSFSVKAMYNDLVVGNAPRLNLVTWKAKIPLKLRYLFGICGRVLY
jgi:hypothetical protein